MTRLSSILVVLALGACTSLSREERCARAGLVLDDSRTRCICPPDAIMHDDGCELSDGTFVPLPDSVEDGSTRDGAVDGGVHDAQPDVPQTCDDGDTSPCEGSSVGECSPGTRTCIDGRWSECADRVEPASERCSGLDEDCDGTPDGPPADALCADAPHTTAASCRGGRCVITTCAAGYGDCDTDPTNGCELNLNNDPLNCGDCGQRCGAGELCSGGRCTPALETEWTLQIDVDSAPHRVVAAIGERAAFAGAVQGAMSIEGRTFRSLGGTDSFVGVANADGTLRWARRVGSNVDDRFTAITTTATEVVAVGWLGDGNGTYDDDDFSTGYLVYGPASVLAVYNASTGNLIRAVRQVSQITTPTAVAVDSASNTVCIAGRRGTTGVLANWNYTSGELRWERTINTGIALGVAAIPGGNCRFFGSISVTTDFGGGAIAPEMGAGFIAGYGPTGTLFNLTLFDGPGDQAFVASTRSGLSPSVVAASNQDVPLLSGPSTFRGTVIAQIAPDDSPRWQSPPLSFAGAAPTVAGARSVAEAGDSIIGAVWGTGALVIGHFEGTFEGSAAAILWTDASTGAIRVIDVWTPINPPFEGIRSVDLAGTNGAGYALVSAIGRVRVTGSTPIGVAGRDTITLLRQRIRP